MKDNQRTKLKYSDKWELHEEIDSNLTHDQMKKIINQKLAKIIIEMEYNSISYMPKEEISD